MKLLTPMEASEANCVTFMSWRRLAKILKETTPVQIRTSETVRGFKLTDDGFYIYLDLDGGP